MRWSSLVVCALLAGCGAGARVETPRTTQLAANRTERPTQAEMDQRLYAYADRYAVVLGSAIEDITRDEPDLRRRREAHLLRLNGVSGVYDVVTGRDPFTKLLDLTLVVTLQSRRWIDECVAQERFGRDNGRVVETALRRLRLDIWALAAQELTPEQLQELDGLITTWRRANPTVDGLTFVRFDDVGASRGRALTEEVRDGGGLFAPVDRAVDVAEQSRQLGERLFWLSKRSPSLVTWQLELAADDMLLRPEIGQVTQTIIGMPGIITEQRRAALQDLETVSRQVSPLLDRVLATISGVAPVVGDVRATMTTVAEVTATSERLAKLLIPLAAKPGDPGAPAKPFDIAEYTAAITQVNRTLTEANTALNSVQGMLSGNALTARLQEFNGAATERVEQVTRRVDEVSWFLIWRGIGLIAVFFVMLGTYRWWIHRLEKSS